MKKIKWTMTWTGWCNNRFDMQKPPRKWDNVTGVPLFWFSRFYNKKYAGRSRLKVTITVEEV